MINSIKIISLLVILILPLKIIAQENTQRKLDSKSRIEVVDKICLMLNEKYVFTDKTKEICNTLKTAMKTEKYDTISDPSQFATALMKEIQTASNDLHLKVRFKEGAGKHLKETDNNLKPDPEQEKRFLQALRFENFGISIAQRLNGNVGYISVNEFLDPKYNVEETFASAISFLQNTNAIIIDTRFNGGGDPACVQLLCSYFFNETPVHLNDIYDRTNNETKEYWTLKDLKGLRLPDVPLYILTSDYTFSAAEEFAYDLQSLKRATVVGDTTRGGANPGATFPLDDDFMVFIPTGRAINPVTKSNWDGSGVIPDVSIASENALAKAHLLAVQNMIEKSKEESDKKYFKFLSESIDAEMNALSICDSELKKFTGTYSDRMITYNTGKLFYQYGKRAKMQMTPVSEDTFMLTDLDYVRLKFNKDNMGNYISLTELADTGDNETLVKNE